MPPWMFIFNIVASCLWAFQIIFGFLSFLRTKSSKKISIDHIPKLSVIIPAFNEMNQTIQKVVDSVIIQHNVEIEIFVVDDGSTSPVSIQEHSKVQLLRLEKNQGKRAAQIHAINKATHDWIVTVDSDTILKSDALFELYKAAIINNWDGVTGNVKLLNEKQNILTKMVACLYWYGFNQERASQSFFGKVTCCSGALSLWKKDTILKTADLYLNQKFMGRECVAGDDRFLTCLFAAEGKKIGCALNSIAYTISPANFKGFLQQQLRWTRSNTPALLFVLKNILYISPIFIFFMLAVMFRYTYFAVLYCCVLIDLITFGPTPIIVLLTILVISALKATNAFLYTRNWRMFYLMPLSIVAFFVLSPVVIYGVLTPTSTGWVTRTKKELF